LLQTETEKQKFVYLRCQTTNCNRRLMFQQTSLSMLPTYSIYSICGYFVKHYSFCNFKCWSFFHFWHWIVYFQKTCRNAGKTQHGMRTSVHNYPHLLVDKSKLSSPCTFLDLVYHANLLKRKFSD
jgi:hypothetical protein